MPATNNWKWLPASLPTSGSAGQAPHRSPPLMQVFNILCEHPETVAAFLVPRARSVVARGDRGAAIRYLTPARVLAKLLAAPLRAGRYFDSNGERSYLTPAAESCTSSVIQHHLLPLPRPTLCHHLGKAVLVLLFMSIHPQTPCRRRARVPARAPAHPGGACTAHAAPAARRRPPRRAPAPRLLTRHGELLPDDCRQRCSGWRPLRRWLPRLRSCISWYVPFHCFRSIGLQAPTRSLACACIYPSLYTQRLPIFSTEPAWPLIHVRQAGV